MKQAASRRIIRLALVLAAALTASAPLAASAAQAVDTRARTAIVIDATSGAVLMEKDADRPIPPASMSKLMTVYMVFEALKSGKLSLEDEFRVSEAAWNKEGSKMFVREGDRVAVSNLLRGVIVQSGNDACIVLAEGLAGTEEAFAKAMTDRAAEIGLTHSRFLNSTGLPADGHEMSARDLATLAGLIIRDFPDYYPIYSQREFTWEGITQGNRNPLLGLDIGADGLKTGHTEEAGYGLVASAERDGRRVILAVTGLDSVKARAEEGERLMNWAFREYETAKVLEKGDMIDEAPVWIGAQSTVPLVAADDVWATTPFAARDELKARLRFEGPVPAPIAKGQPLGELVIEAPDMAPITVALVAGADVAKGGFLVKLGAAAELGLGRVLAAASSE